MTDASDITPPKDPAHYRPRPLLGATFWAMIAFGVLCVLAGVAVANFLPRWFAGRPAAHAGESAPPPEPAAATAPVAVTPPPAPEEARPPSVDLARLNARMGILESRQAHVSQAAASALAAATIADASQSTGPFADAVAAYSASGPPSPELAALARFAASGAPSRTALAASFPDYAARAASAAHAPGEKAGLGDRLVYMLSKVVSLRRVGDVPGDSPDALLARAERLVADGDLDRALKLLDRLPPAARDAIGPWRARAERRAEIDRDAEALRARALQELAAETRGPAA
ncbi:MAG: COG4223 family protein [Phenylobacterium sp.]